MPIWHSSHFLKTRHDGNQTRLIWTTCKMIRTRQKQAKAKLWTLLDKTRSVKIQHYSSTASITFMASSTGKEHLWRTPTSAQKEYFSNVFRDLWMGGFCWVNTRNTPQLKPNKYIFVFHHLSVVVPHEKKGLALKNVHALCRHISFPFINLLCVWIYWSVKTLYTANHTLNSCTESREHWQNPRRIPRSTTNRFETCNNL